MTDQDLKTIEAMEKYGGSFVKSLAELCRHADIINLEKLKKAFPDYFAQYEEKANDYL